MYVKNCSSKQNLTSFSNHTILNNFHGNIKNHKNYLLLFSEKSITKPKHSIHYHPYFTKKIKKDVYIPKTNSKIIQN